MLEDLTGKLESTLRKLRGYGKLTEKNISESLKEIRRALLEADVNFKVVKNIESVKDGINIIDENNVSIFVKVDLCFLNVQN